MLILQIPFTIIAACLIWEGQKLLRGGKIKLGMIKKIDQPLNRVHTRIAGYLLICTGLVLAVFPFLLL